MISHFLDAASTRAGERYVNFLMSLRGVLASTASTNPLDGRVFGAIRAGSYEVARSFLDSETEHFSADLERAQKAAQTLAQQDVVGGPVTAKTPLLDYREVMEGYHEQELRAQIERDINALISKRREMVVQASLAAYTRGLDLTSVQGSKAVRSAYEEQLGHDRFGVKFYFTDRSGKRWPSQRFVRQLYRHSLLTFALESYMHEAASFGIQTFEVVHPENNHSHNGTLISLAPRSDVIQLADIRDEVFHPNSNAFLKAVGEPEPV